MKEEVIINGIRRYVEVRYVEGTLRGAFYKDSTEPTARFFWDRSSSKNRNPIIWIQLPEGRKRALQQPADAKAIDIAKQMILRVLAGMETEHGQQALEVSVEQPNTWDYHWFLLEKNPDRMEEQEVFHVTCHTKEEALLLGREAAEKNLKARKKNKRYIRGTYVTRA